MPLSEHEQRLLSQMEQQLLNDDPKFASAMNGPARRGSSSTKRLLLGGAGIVVGLLLLVVGVASQLVVVGVLAFVLMLGGAAYAVSAPRRPTPGPVGLVGPDGAPRPGGGNPGKGRPGGRPGQSSFMERMEERWQKRREDGGR